MVRPVYWVQEVKEKEETVMTPRISGRTRFGTRVGRHRFPSVDRNRGLEACFGLSVITQGWKMKPGEW